MTLPIYHVDAFTSKLFSGNPAAVVPLEKWLNDSVLQNIAAENNLSETAFFVMEENHYHIRWMTPATEVDLCGHATLASAFVIFNFIEKDATTIKLTSKSGELFVDRDGEILSLNFPANKPKPYPISQEVLDCFDVKPIETLRSTFDLIVFESENFIINYEPRIEQLKKLHHHGVIITSIGKKADFVSRVFVPNQGINEDPVTGSAHTVLVPYWSEMFGKKNFRALQVSKRGGELYCEDLGERVKIAGSAVLYSSGSLFLGL